VGGVWGWGDFGVDLGVRVAFEKKKSFGFLGFCGAFEGGVEKHVSWFVCRVLGVWLHDGSLSDGSL
jgi:hypothetical protein